MHQRQTKQVKQGAVEMNVESWLKHHDKPWSFSNLKTIITTDIEVRQISYPTKPFQLNLASIWSPSHQFFWTEPLLQRPSHTGCLSECSWCFSRLSGCPHSVCRDHSAPQMDEKWSSQNSCKQYTSKCGLTPSYFQYWLTRWIFLQIVCCLYDGVVNKFICHF